MEWKISITGWTIFCIRYSRLFRLYHQYLKKSDNPPIRIYVSKTENRIRFIIETEYYLELLLPETTKLLGFATSKITKDKNGKIVPH